MIGIYGVLLVMNLGAWIWAGVEFGWNLSLLGVALIVYGLGLRHAVDADHIAAIDNVTRKLMQGGDRPVTVGFFFALGHPTIVVIASLIVAGPPRRWTCLAASAGSSARRCPRSSCSRSR